MKISHLSHITKFIILSLVLFACEEEKNEETAVVVEEEEVIEEEDNSISTPTSYVFSSRFLDDGSSSVSYSGQTVRNLLLNDLKSLTDSPSKSGGTAVTEESMLQLYDYDDSYDLTTRTSPDTPALESKYSSISTGKNLIGKMDSDVVIGYDKTADELVKEWIAEIASLSSNSANLETYLAYTSSEGLNLSQMINKTLLGAVPYSQGTSNYLAGLEDDGNAEAKSDGGAYSEMEHHWDEAYGYFGAARDYNTGYSDDDDRKSGPYFDSNGDGAIDFKSEYNFGISVNAAKRDIGAADGQVDFTKAIFDAFLEGRTLIHNQAAISDILTQRDIIVNNWEKVIAATVVHYVNDCIADMTELYESDSDAGPLSEGSANLNKHWGEMRGFTIALQFNDFKLISDSDLKLLSDTMGLKPVYPADGQSTFDDYKNVLSTTVKNTLQSAYDFSDENMAGW